VLGSELPTSGPACSRSRLDLRNNQSFHRFTPATIMCFIKILTWALLGPLALP
jgi:hypothetical protein